MKKELVIFVVEDNPFYLQLVVESLKRMGYENTEGFQNSSLFLDNLYRNPDLVMLDHELDESDSHSGIDLLRQVKAFNPEIEVIMLSGQESVDVAVSSLKYGAFDYIIKDTVAIERINHVIERAQQLRSLMIERRWYRRIRTASVVSLVLLAGATLLFFKLGLN